MEIKKLIKACILTQIISGLLGAIAAIAVHRMGVTWLINYVLLGAAVTIIVMDCTWDYFSKNINE